MAFFVTSQGPTQDSKKTNSCFLKHALKSPKHPEKAKKSHSGRSIVLSPEAVFQE